MSESDYPTVEQLFEQAISQPSAAQRRTFIDRACAGDPALRKRLEGLLQAHESAGNFLIEPPVAPADETLSLGKALAEGAGTVIDRYKLLQQIGEGGFGAVYMAEQTVPVSRRVALKIIKLGMDTKQVIARFEAERQALAMMEHPNIAKVLDAGATETGRPYFVMELVKGEPITQYCDKHKLTVAVRLKLFQQVCHAVQHAHQKGIIHRDIKPSNVMITLHDGKPVPKVIDFGIAKATNSRLTEKTVFTEYRQFIGTPEYMSPEQAEMSGLDIDTRSDVYSLGVLLYELLTGTTPFDGATLRCAGYGEIQRIIREETPPKPSTRLSTLETLPSVAAHRHTEPKKLGMTIRGDLDWIVMKALEKDRQRRYETANGFAMDIQRHLSNQPVEASPPSASYRLKKLIRRNKGVFAAATLVFLVLSIGVVGTTWGLVAAARANDELLSSNRNLDAALNDADEQRRRAEENERQAVAAQAAELARAEELEQVVDFQASQLSSIDTALMGTRLRRDILDRRRDALESSGADEDRTAAAVAELESILASVNFTDVALATLDENIFDSALRAIYEQFADSPLVRAQLLQTIASALRAVGQLDRAAAPQDQALQIRRSLLGDDHADTLDSIHSMGALLYEKGKYDEAEPHFQTALEGRRRVLGDDDPSTLIAINSMGKLRETQGRPAEAEPYYQEALRVRRRVLGNEHPHTLVSISNMGILHYDQGRYAQAEEYYKEAMDTRRRVLGEDHNDTLVSMNNMGFFLTSQGRHAEAEPYFHHVLDHWRRSLGDEHPRTLVAISNLGEVLYNQRKHAEAEPYYREALDTRRRILGNEHRATLVSVSNMGLLLFEYGRYAEAEAYYREALETRRRILGSDHAHTLVSINNMGYFLQSQGRHDEAELHYREAVETRRRVLGDEHPLTLNSIANLADLMRKAGRLDEAERLGREAADTANRVLPQDHWARGRYLADHARSLAAMQRFPEAEREALEAWAILSSTLGPQHSRAKGAIEQLVELYDAWHDVEPHGGYEEKAAEWRAKLSPIEGTTDR